MAKCIEVSLGKIVRVSNAQAQNHPKSAFVPKWMWKKYARPNLPWTGNKGKEHENIEI